MRRLSNFTSESCDARYACAGWIAKPFRFLRITTSNVSSSFDKEPSLALDEVKLLAPVTPSKIVCVGRNYREHAAELGNKMPDEPCCF